MSDTHPQGTIRTSVSVMLDGAPKVGVQRYSAFDGERYIAYAGSPGVDGFTVSGTADELHGYATGILDGLPIDVVPADRTETIALGDLVSGDSGDVIVNDAGTQMAVDSVREDTLGVYGDEIEVFDREGARIAYGRPSDAVRVLTPRPSKDDAESCPDELDPPGERGVVDVHRAVTA